MESGSNNICCGCLSGGRKMKSVNNFWSDQVFLYLFIEIPMLSVASSSLCWECEAQITKFAVFREQVKNCSKVLQQYIQKDDSPKTVSKLGVYTLPFIDLNSDIQPEFTEEPNSLSLYNHDINQMEVCVKEEPVPTNINDVDDHQAICKIVKTESDVYSDDDISLIDIRNDREVENDLLNAHKKVKRIDGTVKLKKRIKMFEEIELTQEEILNERTLMEQREEYVNAMFRCDKCIMPFPNKDDLKEHVLRKHKQHINRHACDVCSRTFVSTGSLLTHMRRHASRRRCSLCAHITATDRAAAIHYIDKHKDSEMYHLATKAYQRYKKKSQAIIEMNGGKSMSQYPCGFCEKKFRWKTSLRKHVETHRIESGHKRKPYCEICRMPFSNTSNLQKHVKTSSKHQIKLKLRKLKEGITEATSEEQKALDIESIKSKINSQKEQFSCPQCEKKFQWKGNLLRHIKSHVAKANGELVCEPCNRTFSSIATYKQHMRSSKKHVSENEFKYMCSDCGKRFANKVKLRDHIDWDHLKNYRHKCSDCSKVFKSHTSLYLHRQVVHKHCNVVHLCDLCGKSFQNQAKLRNHIVALHTQESPYKCDRCPARFGWHSCLSRHVRRVHKDTRRNTVQNE